ncbi:hypothetical protein [Coprococcus comes]|uniref:hypothetical protein n=1 Tax=Coprococcus comes TaxID=410072 RepID=UPI0018998F89|nr:hypothetical protein [Coprococcus comes]
MKKVINGCIYAIDLGGTEEYEFKGVHPAMVVRMLKEEKMYYVVPLTTYTKERWEKCKRQGFGCRVVSTNSIARVDKINIVTEKQIHSRYYNSEKLVCAEPAEIEKVILRVEEYFKLSNQKGLNEYKKFYSEKKVFENKMYQFWIDNKFDDVYYNVKIEKGSIELELGKDEIRNLTFNDIVQVLSELLDASKLHFEKKGNQSIIICFNVDHKIALTFQEKYDKFKSQKGSVEA